MEITVYIPDESVELLGENPTETLQDVVDKELIRLWHVRRCQPKPPQERRPVGRPPLDRRWNELVKAGIQIFGQLRRIAGAKDFKRVYGVYQDQFDALVGAGNKIALEDFLERRDWQRRGR